MTTPENQTDADYSTDVSREISALAARTEALLFVAPGPVPASQLASALEVTVRRVEEALAYLAAGYQSRGLRLQHSRSGVQLTTPPELAADVERFLNLENTAYLSRAALEVLAIIAYQQPATRPQVDAVRGVNSDSVMRTLLRFGLIEEAGRSDGPGRPILYVTTSELLQHFGLSSLDELPPLNLEPDGETTADAGVESVDAAAATSTDDLIESEIATEKLRQSD